MGKLVVVGHKNPDTDSIVSALTAVDYFKNVLNIPAEAFRSGKLNNETKFVLETVGVKSPKLISLSDTQNTIALVDHNEIDQAFDELDFAKVSYVFDHHKLSVQTEKPIFFRAEPLGSTASLIAKMFNEKNAKISKITAELLIAGILSDTLNMVGPTTTLEDKEIISSLNKIAQINIQDFADRMFTAKSSLEGISVQEIITLDYKAFKTGKFKIGIGTWETTLPESVNEKKEEIIEALKAKKENEKLDYLFFMVVDILKQNSYLYIISENEKGLAEKIFKSKIENDLMFLKNIVSRKKQIIPPLMKELS